MAREKPESGGEVLEKPRTKTKPPQLFQVVLHNDDYTTQEFVVYLLESVFSKPAPEAYRIMLHVHLNGRGLCGLFPYEIAETKVATVHDLARAEGFPLRATMEEA
jgi:ATP-dependent Clp protease adaptor protein ClpS